METVATRILRVNPRRPEPWVIGEAAEVIRRGGTVAFPTETVYGLGADALNPEAVRKIFWAKRRPADNPLIVHIAEPGWVDRLAEEVPEEAARLAERFWPGPLTLVLRKSRVVPDITTSGLETIAVRMPRHPVALALIRESGRPIAAPSANLAGRPSPTTAQHVAEDLMGRVDLILDGGPTEIGVESTVIDLTVHPPQVLRPGGVSVEELRKVLGVVELHPAAVGRAGGERPRSPGMKYRHYAPRAELIVVEGEPGKVAKKVEELARGYRTLGRRVGILATDENLGRYRSGKAVSVGSRKNPDTIARNIFRVLREMDKEGVDVIIAEGIPEEGIGLAVMNRLRKASGFNIIHAE